MTYKKENKLDKEYLRELKRSEKRNSELGKAKAVDPRGYKAYRDRMEVKRRAKSGSYTGYSPEPKMTREEFLKSIS